MVVVKKYVWVLEWGEGLNNYDQRFKLFSSEEAAERYSTEHSIGVVPHKKRVND